MLMGDKVKYLGLILGVAFCTLLTAQQASVFVGVLRLSTGLIRSIPEVDIWVMRTGVGTTDQPQQMPAMWMNRVRGVIGVDWAVPLYKGASVVRTEGESLRQVSIIGIDDATGIGAPTDMIAGKREDLNQPDAVIMDIAAYKRVFPSREAGVGAEIEIGKKRARVVGVCRASGGITSRDILFARRSLAVELAQEANDTVSFVLVKAKAGANIPALVERIKRQTGLEAQTTRRFEGTNIQWTLDNTGMVQILGAVIVLGIVVGVLVVGQTFYMFGVENQRFFATFKALGAQDGVIMRMIAIQAFVVALIGFGLGIGAAGVLLTLGDTDLSPMRTITLSGMVSVWTGLAIPVLVMITAMLGSRRAVLAEPAMVFR